MSAKRQATTNLNHDNWDQEDEPEERGTFKKATEDELKSRVIKKARRKVPSGNAGSDATDDDGAPKSAFSGFAGFGKTPTGGTLPSGLGATTGSPFSFLSKITTQTSSSSASGTTTVPTINFTFGSTSKIPEIKPKNDITPSNSNNTTVTTKTEGGKSGSYQTKLKGLNQAVSEWIKTHVDKNPVCLLTPIFKDYEKYLKEIEEEESQVKKLPSQAPEKNASPEKSLGTNTEKPFVGFKFSGTSPTLATASGSGSKGSSNTGAPMFSLGSTFQSPTSSTTIKTSIFGGVSKPTAEPTKSNGFSFGLKPDEKNKTSDLIPTTTKGFTFGSKVEAKPSSTPFTFGKPATGTTNGNEDEKKPAAFSFTPGATPFTFGNIKPPAPATPTSTLDGAANNEDEEDQPPKVEFKQVVEEDSVYSKKCKVFVKKDGNYVDRGVGTLYLKPVKDSSKTQLLVRADTNLGNILVNLILSDGIPTQRMGKNNVMMVCVPSPDVDKATPLLLRVKTSEEADELLATLEKYKN